MHEPTFCSEHNLYSSEICAYSCSYCFFPEGIWEGEEKEKLLKFGLQKLQRKI